MQVETLQLEFDGGMRDLWKARLKHSKFNHGKVAFQAFFERARCSIMLFAWSTCSQLRATQGGQVDHLDGDLSPTHHTGIAAKPITLFFFERICYPIQ